MSKYKIKRKRPKRATIEKKKATSVCFNLGKNVKNKFLTKKK